MNESIFTLVELISLSPSVPWLTVTNEPKYIRTKCAYILTFMHSGVLKQ